MLPFPIALKAGESSYRQVVYAATKAVLSGMLPAGSPFPSVRELSQSLKINPNTAHKVVAELVRDGLLEVMPGLGTVVAAPRVASRSERAALLADPVEQLVVEARRVGLARRDVIDAIETRWTQLFGDDADPSRTTGDHPHADAATDPAHDHATHGDADAE